ncbi:hypothetical protein ACDY96_08765 [Rhizobium mongolense]|uniref:hypothetical protein n=1 Tax=Rhizobium TaxID=379 RepID=UPI0024B1CAA1|nr:hypothetical protein [Rhizobium sp. CC1099]WFU88941.1 hypothetical protein QA644_07825 [Rhizobium sp. CC1099]
MKVRISGGFGPHEETHHAILLAGERGSISSMSINYNIDWLLTDKFTTRSKVTGVISKPEVPKRLSKLSAGIDGVRAASSKA